MVTKTKTTTKKATAKNSAISAAELKARIQHHLQFTLGKVANTEETKSAHWQATSLALQDIVVAKLKQTKERQFSKDAKSVNYLSLEYLMGRLLSNNLHNVDLYDTTEKALKTLGFDLADLCEQGPDLALGNGGLGRLAACFLDSLATLDYNAMGYGIHYQHGLFKQAFIPLKRSHRQGREISCLQRKYPKYVTSKL